MTGFIRGLFGSKDKGQGTELKAEAQPKARPARESATGAYFLEDSAARTMGDAAYMKTSKTVRRTFPKTVDSPEHMELIQDVSAMNRVVQSGTTAAKSASAATPAPQAEPTVQSIASSSDEAALRRRRDSNMDMFRNMAKDLKK